ncbi:hypothetical protein PPYR_09319 [Photinus pyralis]|uniref:Protein takeout n=1 Tax=Photinus pyralis TaxID=7054 RepID=A0A5N4ALZ3_PHOPY|nr:hypothetical protein PPYR_09319 [Photinus pyralis]
MSAGVPECNIPSIEPLVMNELISEQSVGLSLTANNVKTYGCSSYTVTSLKVNMDEQTYEFDTEFPLLSIEAQYNVSGKLLMMPVNGAGPLYANLTNCKSKTMLKGELYDRDGETYLRYKDLSLHIQIGGGSIKIENLFRGDKFISDIVHESLNKNLNAFLVELMPAVERALASTFLEVGNKIVHPYTYKQLFPY